VVIPTTMIGSTRTQTPSIDYELSIVCHSIAVSFYDYFFDVLRPLGMLLQFYDILSNLVLVPCTGSQIKLNHCFFFHSSMQTWGDQIVTWSVYISHTQNITRRHRENKVLASLGSVCSLVPCCRCYTCCCFFHIVVRAKLWEEWAREMVVFVFYFGFFWRHVQPANQSKFCQKFCKVIGICFLFQIE